MASVYKLPIAFELLTQIAERRLTFDQMVAIGPSDIRACCTLSRRHPNGGITLTLRELLELMITESDNTAGDAVLKAVGGPSAVERRLSALGFTGIHVNRYEGAIAFEMMGVTAPPPESAWTLDAAARAHRQSPASRPPRRARPLHNGSARHGDAGRHGGVPAQAPARRTAPAALHRSAARSAGSRENRAASAEKPSAVPTPSSRTRPARPPSSSTTWASSRCPTTAGTSRWRCS